MAIKGVMTLAQFTVRKDYQGNTISEEIKPIPGDPEVEFRFLGALLAANLDKDPQFRKFCEEYEHHV